MNPGFSLFIPHYLTLFSLSYLSQKIHNKSLMWATPKAKIHVVNATWLKTLVCYPYTIWWDQVVWQQYGFSFPVDRSGWRLVLPVSRAFATAWNKPRRKDHWGPWCLWVFNILLGVSHVRGKGISTLVWWQNLNSGYEVLLLLGGGYGESCQGDILKSVLEVNTQCYNLSQSWSFIILKSTFTSLDAIRTENLKTYFIFK